MAERNIPNVWDIFGYSSNNKVYASENAHAQITTKFKQLSVEQKIPGNDSAVSVGSSDDEDSYRRGRSSGDGGRRTNKKKKQERGCHKDNYNNRTVTERDVKHLERHLSMKKTIRKKIMRDLQQAFVEDPNEFRVDPDRMSPEKKKEINIHSLNFAEAKSPYADTSFLDMLKQDDHNVINDDDSGNGSPTREYSGVRARKYDRYFHHIESYEEPAPTSPPLNKPEKKISFWKKLTGKGKNKR